MMLKNGLTHQTMMKMTKISLAIDMNKKVIDVFKDEPAGKVMAKFIVLRANA